MSRHCIEMKVVLNKKFGGFGLSRARMVPWIIPPFGRKRIQAIIQRIPKRRRVLVIQKRFHIPAVLVEGAGGPIHYPYVTHASVSGASLFFSQTIAVEVIEVEGQ